MPPRELVEWLASRPSMRAESKRKEKGKWMKGAHVTRPRPVSRHTRRRPDDNDNDEEMAEKAAPSGRDEEFWFEDGTIILVAAGVEFKVYRGVLAEHSAVFADMFSLPQPPHDLSDSDAPVCPVVHLDDPPEELREVLRALLPKKGAR